MDRPYFPNEVPRKCEFNQTLAANANGNQMSRQENDASTVNTFATVYRKVDRSLVTRCVKVSPPKYDIFAAGSSCQHRDPEMRSEERRVGKECLE